MGLVTSSGLGEADGLISFYSVFPKPLCVCKQVPVLPSAGVCGHRNPKCSFAAKILFIPHEENMSFCLWEMASFLAGVFNQYQYTGSVG